LGDVIDMSSLIDRCCNGHVTKYWLVAIICINSEKTGFHSIHIHCIYTSSNSVYANKAVLSSSRLLNTNFLESSKNKAKESSITAWMWTWRLTYYKLLHQTN